MWSKFKTALSKQCKHARAWEDKYYDFVKVAAIKNAQSDEFALRLPVYVQGIRDANILISSDTDTKNAYEIGNVFWLSSAIGISINIDLKPFILLQSLAAGATHAHWSARTIKC